MRRVAVAAVMLLGVPVLSLGGTAGSAAAVAPGTVTNYTGASTPAGIAAGPDGALWFANYSASSIGRISTTGMVTSYTGTGVNGPQGIAAGSDGALWFTNAGNSSIGRISTTGTVTNYTGTGINLPFGIAPGPDGALWFTNAGNGSIGRISTAGTVTNYAGTGINTPQLIAAGPDGALWFTTTGDSIGRISTSGTVTNYTGTGISNPLGIAPGPDGALWFANLGNRSIGRITTSGTVTNYTGTGINGPFGIAAGADGALWFTNINNSSIGRITTSGTVTNYTGTGINGPSAIAAGPDGGLWFSNTFNDSIGRIEPGEPTPVVTPGGASVVEGNAGTVELQVPVTLSNPSSQTVTVQWTTGSTTSANPLIADPATDFTAASGMVTFAPGETAKSVSISVNGDGLVEPDEYLLVSFHHPTNAKIGGYLGLGFGKITNDDRAVVRPGGASVVEGDSGPANLIVPVTLSNPSTQTITVDWNTGPAGPAPRADPASDFTAASGTVEFAPGETAKSVTISVNGDVLVEPDEWITVSFKHPTNAKMGGFYGLGFGVITNDD